MPPLQLSTTTHDFDPIQVKMIAPDSTQDRLLRLRMFLGSKLFHRRFYHRSYTMRLDYRTHLKTGRLTMLEAEANNIRFVATHTTIPVPKLRELVCIDDNLNPRWGHLVMEHAKGKQLSKQWAHMSEATKEKVIQQLHNYIAELRALPPPQPELVASATGGPIWEPARVGPPRIGPFTSHAEFHTCLRAGLPLSEVQKYKFPWTAPILRAHSLQYDTKFTHGDLAGRNILCTADGTITCILDWETSGWYPEYWEFTKAHHCPSNGLDWTKRIGLITGDYPDQLEAEKQIFEHFSTEPSEHYIYKEES